MMATEDGAVLDFTHVWVAPVTRISLARRDGERIAGAVGLTVGEDLTLVPTLWNGTQKLSGDGAVQWSVDHADTLAVLKDGSADRRRLRARAAGTATITVALVGAQAAQAAVDVEVLP